ncbi:hypothetical protein cypCar_00045642, partial [Cyprinus carpio]
MATEAVHELTVCPVMANGLSMSLLHHGFLLCGHRLATPLDLHCNGSPLGLLHHGSILLWICSTAQKRCYCANGINGAEIRIGNSLENNGTNNPICAVIPDIPAGESNNYSCYRLEGRYVIIHIPGDWKILTLCEVEVYGYLAENLAVAGTAIQSSTSADWFAEKAIDRGLQQLYTGCSSTIPENNPWWRLDLHHIYRVSKVVITNRKDCCAERINGAEIRIGNSLENNGTNNPICAVIPAIPAGESYSYSCDGMEGRYVNLIIPGDMKTLTLCEVKVYGE